MFITVMYQDGKIGMVEFDQLDHLIALLAGLGAVYSSVFLDIEE